MTRKIQTEQNRLPFVNHNRSPPMTINEQQKCVLYVYIYIFRYMYTYTYMADKHACSARLRQTCQFFFKDTLASIIMEVETYPK